MLVRTAQSSELSGTDITIWPGIANPLTTQHYLRTWSHRRSVEDMEEGVLLAHGLKLYCRPKSRTPEYSHSDTTPM